MLTPTASLLGRNFDSLFQDRRVRVIIRSIVLAVVLLLVTVGSAQAQHRRPVFSSPQLTLPAQRNASAARSEAISLPPASAYAPTYWREGAIAGAIAVGISGVAIAGGLCGMGENSSGCTGQAVAGGIMGAAVGFGLGALIGGQFSKGNGG